MPGILSKLGGIAKGALGGLASGGPAGAIAGGLGGLLGGGGLQGAGLGALGGLAGGSAGLDPALIAAISGIGNAQLGEQTAAREAAEAAANQRNDMLSRNLQLAENQFASQAPLRDAGMGAVTNFLGGNTRGIFNDSAFAGDLGLGAGGAPSGAPVGPQNQFSPGPGPQVLPQPPVPAPTGGREGFDPTRNSTEDLLKRPDVGGLRGLAGKTIQNQQLAPDNRKDGELNALQLLKRRGVNSQIGQAIGNQPPANVANAVRAF